MTVQIRNVQYRIRNKQRHLLTAERALIECISLDNEFNIVVQEALKAVAAAQAILTVRQIVTEHYQERLAQEKPTAPLDSRVVDGRSRNEA